MSVGYGGKTPRFFIPYITVGDVVSNSSEEQAAQTIENQLIGLIAGHSGGHGVIRSGAFSSIFAASNSQVYLNTPGSGLAALEAFITQIYVRAFSTLTWTGLPDNSVLYLYVQIVETDTSSSRVRGDVITGWNDTGIIPNGALLVAKATTTSVSISVDNNPPDRIDIGTVALHAAQNTDPHGTILSQTSIVTSGVDVLGDLRAENVRVNGNMVVSGSTTFVDGLEVFGEARFRNRVVVSGMSNFLGDVVFSGAVVAHGVSTLENLVATSGIENFGILVQHGNIVLDSSATVDGRDISADGVLLDQHISNITTNPHHVTTAQISGVSIFGGDDSKLLGHLPVESGVAVDGVDLSELNFLINGSNADPVFAGTTLTRKGHTHAMSGIAYQYLSLAPEFVGSVTSGMGVGFLDVRRDLSIDAVDENSYRWRADPLGVTSGAGNPVGIWTQNVVPGDMDWISGIELDIRTPGNNPQQYVDLYLYDSAGNQVALANNQHLQSNAISRKEIGVVNPAFAGTFEPGDFFSVLTQIHGTSGSDVYVHGLRITYRTVWPGVV